jgi:hypothetical protein
MLNVLARIVAHRSHEEVALPLWEFVAVVNRETRDGDGRHQEHDWFLHPWRREPLADDGAVGSCA